MDVLFGVPMHDVLEQVAVGDDVREFIPQMSR